MSSTGADQFASERSRSGRSPPPELTTLDARIARAGGTSSTIELQSHRLQQSKEHDQKSEGARLEELVRENGYLRQEIVFYQESRNAMMAFHNQMLQAYHMQQSALRELSNNMALADGHLEQYWGVSLTDPSDLTRV